MKKAGHHQVICLFFFSLNAQGFAVGERQKPGRENASLPSAIPVVPVDESESER
jgi:hypothetical protein